MVDCRLAEVLEIDALPHEIIAWPTSFASIARTSGKPADTPTGCLPPHVVHAACIACRPTCHQPNIWQIIIDTCSTITIFLTIF